MSDEAIEVWKNGVSALKGQLLFLSDMYHREKESDWPLIEFAIIDGYRGWESGRAIYEDTRQVAFSELTPFEGLETSTRMWTEKIDHCNDHFLQTRSLATNIPPLEPDVYGYTHEPLWWQLLNSLLRTGDCLLQSSPIQFTNYENMGPEDWGVMTNDAPGYEWISALFEASWGPARSLGLTTERRVIPSAKPSDKCFYSISRDFFKDSAMLIDWLVSLSPPADADKSTETAEVVTASPTSNLKPCVGKAWSQYLAACKEGGETQTDQQAYDWYQEHRAEDGDMPKFETWSKYLRGARNKLDQQKNHRGLGMPTRSIVSRDELD